MKRTKRCGRLNVERLDERVVPASAGNLDPAFGSGGTTTTHFPAFDGFDQVTAVTVDPASGRTVVVGYTHVSALDQNTDFAIAVFNPDGSPDKSFNGDGRKTIAFDLGGTKADAAGGVAIDPTNGNIVVVGTVQSSNNVNTDIGIAVIDRTGAMDANFNNGSPLIDFFSVNGGSGDTASGVAIDPTTGKIVVVGSVTPGGEHSDFAVYVFNPDGSADGTFGSGNGQQFVRFDAPGNQTVLSEDASAVAIDPSTHDIVIVGTVTNTSFNKDFGIVRLNVSGNLVTANGGMQRIPFDLSGTANQTIVNDSASAVAIDGAGNIVVAGPVQVDANTYEMGIARLLPNLAYDNSFSIDSKQTVSFDTSSSNPGSSSATGVIIDSAGRIVVAGAAKVSNIANLDFAVARLLSNGTLDKSFSTDGKMTIPFDIGGSKSDDGNAVALDPTTGNIVVAGTVTVSASNTDFGVARVLSSDVAVLTLSLTGPSASEFRPGGATAGTLTATETGAGHTFTYSLASGAGSADNANFSISGSKLLTTAALPAGTYSVRVRATDETAAFVEQVFTVAVADDQAVALGNRVLYVSGTAVADSFAFAAGATEHKMVLNGVNLAVPAANVDAVVFYGGAGANTADLTGRGTGDIAGLNPTYGFLADGGVTVWAVNTTQITARAGGTGAVAYLVGTAGADALVATQTAATLSGATYSNAAAGFGAVVAYSQGGADTATLTDSAGNDTFVGTPSYSLLTGAGYANYAIGFASVSASGAAGGTDVAYLADSAGDDTLTASGSQVTVSAPTTTTPAVTAYSVTVNGFDTVFAYGSNGGKNKKTAGTLNFQLFTDNGY